MSSQVPHKVTIKGTVDYCRAHGDMEFPPSYLLIYLDTWFKGTPVVLESADKNPGVTQFEITAELPAGVEKIPRDAYLMFQTYVTTLNDYGSFCREDTGATGLELFQIVNGTEKTNSLIGRPVKQQLVTQTQTVKGFTKALIADSFGMVNGKPSAKNDLRIQTTNEVKGTLHITIDSISTTANGGYFAFDMTHNFNSLSNVQRLIPNIQQYNASSIQNIERFEVNVPKTDNITCFWYPSNITFAAGATGFMAPLPTYLMSKPPVTHPLWWVQQLEIMASRQDMELSDFVAAWTNKSLTDKCIAKMQLISQYVHTIEYVPDRSNGQMIEMFGEAIAMISGDCEDLGKALKMMNEAYKNATTSVTSLQTMATNVAQILQEIHTLSKQYIYMFCLEGVSATHTQNDTDFKDQIDGAHAAVKGLPRDYFGECVARASPQHPLAAVTTLEEYRGKLNVLVGEGTGMLYPIGKTDGHEGLRKLVGDQVDAMKVIKKVLYNPPGDSKFYKQIMLGVTTEFIEDYRVATFYMATPVHQLVNGVPMIKCQSGSKAPVMGKGVPYTLLANKSPLVYLYPNEFVAHEGTTTGAVAIKPFRCEFTQEQVEIMKSIARTVVMPPTFTPVDTVKYGPVVDRDRSRIANPIMDDLCNRLKMMQPQTMSNFNTLMRSTVAAGGSAPAPVATVDNLRCKINYFINPDYLTPKFVQDVVNQIAPLKVVLNANYVIERHLDLRPIYRLTVEYLDHTAMTNTNGAIQPAKTGSLVAAKIANDPRFNAFYW